MVLFKKKQKKEKQDTTFLQFPYLQKMKPREKYIFHSDYFKVDNYYCTVMSFFHNMGANDNFDSFWGINKIPTGLPDGVTTVLLDQVKRMSDRWIRDHQTASEKVADMNDKEQSSAGTNTTKAKAKKAKNDLDIIASELNDGASYLNVKSRMLVKAPSLETLDDAVLIIENLYKERLGSVWSAPYSGNQKQELSNLFRYNRFKKGKGFYFTSTEYAGAYNLVTHGLEDLTGEYVGYMVGDVNNSAVLFDTNGFSHHCVIASEQFNEKRGRVRVSSMWGSKLSQSCMLNNGRVAHLILDGTDLDRLGPKFEDITFRIDMNSGDVNMFEMFGEHKDELSIFPAHMQKLILMAEQAYESTDRDRSIIRGALEDVATKFYIDNRMWVENAGENRDKLRIVGVPHADIPKLSMFVTYLDMEYKALVSSTARDDEKLHAMSILATTFRNMLSNNGDLFNTITSDNIDGAKKGCRAIYDFSSLFKRGIGIAMAQFVNIFGFTVNNLGKGDLLVIHGAEKISESVRPYVMMQLGSFFEKGGRVAYCYNSLGNMLSDRDFNNFDKADYTIFGNMTENILDEYQAKLGQTIPADLQKLVTDRGSAICYIRRDFNNIVFHQDLQLYIE